MFVFFGGSAVAMLQVELKVLEGRQQGKAIPLNVKQFLIGREQDCHLRPNSDLVSRHHCVFTVDDYTVRLRDLGSTNGTFVNGERIQGQVVLKPGDHVAVGKLSFEMVIREGAEVIAGRGAGSARTDAPSSIFSSAEPVPSHEASDTAALNASDTIELPVAEPGDDTAVAPGFPPGQPVGMQPGYIPAPQYGYPPGYGIPAGYGVPGYPQGYPQSPGYPPPGYGMPPGYGAMPYGTPQMMPGMPGGYGMPAQQPHAPEQKQPAEELEVVLPDPATTGAKDPTPPAAPPVAAEGEEQAAAAAPAKKPSDAAADIIRMHRGRRTT